MSKSEATTLSLERYERPARDWIVAAQALADERKHAEVTPLHLLVRGLERSPAISEVLRRAAVDSAGLSAAAERALAALPRADEPAYLSARFLDLLARAERDADRARARSVGVEHLLTSITQEVRGPAGEVLLAFGVGPGSLSLHMAPLRESPAFGPRSGPDEVEDLVRAASGADGAPVIGREEEIRRLVTILERHDRNNPLLVGEPGIGKRAIVRGLARAIADAKVPGRLRGARLLELDIGSIWSGARTRAEADARLQSLLEGGAAILVIPSLEQAFGGVLASTAGEALRAAERRGVRMIGTTTPEGLRLLSDKAPSFVHELTTVDVEEPSPESATEILRGIRQRLERHHGVRIEDSAVTSAVELAKRHLPDRHLPEGALDLLDEAASRRRVEEAARAGGGDGEPELVVGEAHVAATLALWTGIPVAKILEAEADRLLKMEERLERRVVGQSEAVRALSLAVRRGRLGLRDPRRPIGSFLFLGPSGVGKTELAKALAGFLFDDESALTRLDMSEFMERHMAQRLLGAPPGYADSEQGGFLTEAVRKRPYSVLLFDEVEKAHQDVFNLLLQVLDEGRLTDGRGRLADFTNTVVILTSNIGSARILDSDPRLFETPDGREALRGVLLDELGSFFRPEFLNRLDDVVVFRPLAREDLARIVDLQLDHVRALLAPRRVRLEVDEAAKARLVELGYQPALGARPLRRAIVAHIQDPLAEQLLGKDLPDDALISVRWDGEAFAFETRGKE